MAFFDAVSTSQPTTGAAPTVPVPSNPSNSAPQNTDGFFSSVQASNPSASNPSKSFFDSVSTPIKTETGTNEPAPKDNSVPSPYFSATTPSGASLGFSITKDSSGKPFFAYRNPGDTATTTDQTRVATSFDPRVPQKMDQSTFTNPRAVASRAALKTSMGGTYNDELDHVIALELSGSNDPSNLRIEPNVPGTRNTPTDPDENRIAHDVASGKISLFQGQTELAQIKGIKLPWTDANDATSTHSLTGENAGISGHITDFFNGIASKLHDAFGPDVHANVLSPAVQMSTSTPATSTDTMITKYNTQKTTFDAALADFKQKDDTYAKSVAAANKSGNISPTLRASLTKQQADLTAQYDKLNKMQDDLNAMVDPINKAQTQKEIDARVAAGGSEIRAPKSSDTMAYNQPSATDYGGVNAGTPGGGLGLLPKLSGSDIPVLGGILKGSRDAYNTFAGAVNDEGNRLMDTVKSFLPDKGGHATVGDQAYSAVRSVLGAVGVAWAAPSGILKGAESVPIIGPLAKGVNSLLGYIGNIPLPATEKIIDEMPLDEGSKSKLKSLADEAIPLAIQLFTLKAVHSTGADIRDELKQSYETIAEKKANGVELSTPEKGLARLAELQTSMRDQIVRGYQGIKDLPKAIAAIPGRQGGYAAIPSFGAKPEGESNTDQQLQETQKNATDYVEKNKDATVNQYKAENGNVFNVDRMKDLIPGHVENPTVSEAFHKPAAELMNSMINDKLNEPPTGKPVIFMSGASGAGKSTTVDNLAQSNEAHAIIDGTFSDGTYSRDQMRLALKNGHKVEVKYVENTPDRIINNLVSRAEAGGRTVPISTAYDTLQKSRQNVMRANGEFGANPNFHVSVIDNRGKTPYIINNGIDYLRDNPYSNEDIAKAKDAAYAKIESLHGTIPEKIYQGLTRRKTKAGVVSEVVGGHGEKSTEERGRKEAPSLEPVSISSEVREANINSAIDRIAESKDPAEISVILKNELQIPENEVKALSEKLSNLSSPKNIRSALEGDITERTPANKDIMANLPPELSERAIGLEHRREALENNPARALSKYAATTGEFKGRLPEVTGKTDANYFGRHGDTIVTEHGFESSEQARDAYEKYMAEKEKYQQDYSQFKNDLKEHVSNERDKASAVKRARFESARKEAQAKAQSVVNAEHYKASLRERIKENAMKPQKRDNLIKAIGRDFNPLKHEDEYVQDTFKKWYGDKLAARELAQEEFQKFDKPPMDDMRTVHNYQAGMDDPKEHAEIKKIFDSMYKEAYDRGVVLDYRKNYLPQVYANKLEEVKVAAEKYLESKGLDKTMIDAYMRGEELPLDVRNRLKLHAFFSEHRIFPTYAEAEQFGLKPKYKNIPALAAHYRETLETIIANKNLLMDLKNAGKIAPFNMAPPDWKHLNAVNFKDYSAPAPLARMIDGFFRDENNLDSSQMSWKKFAEFNKFSQHMVLSTGVPYTNIHFFGIGQAYKALETGIGGLVTLRPDILVDEMKNLGTFLKSHSNEASVRFFEKNQRYITLMAQNRLNVGDHIARFGEIYGNVSRNGIWEKVLGTVKDKFEDVFTRKMFGSMLPQMYIQTFKSAFDRMTADGIPEDEAGKQAADIVRKSMGMSDLTMRSKDMEDKISSVFFAPKFRESLVNIYLNGVKGLGKFGDSSFARNRSFIVGSTLMYIAYNLINKQTSGQYMWQNPGGHIFSIRVPLANGQIIYIPFGPSIFAVARNAIGGAVQVGQGQFIQGTETELSNLSMGFQTLSNILTNANYFGNPIYNPNDTTATKALKISQYLGGQFTPQYITGILNLLEKKDQPLYQTLSEANALPITFGTTAKEAASTAAATLNAQAATRYQNTQQAEALNEQFSKLPPDEANKKLNDLMSTNPVLGNEVSKIADQAAAGFTKTERMIKLMGVSNGERAKYIANQLNALPDDKAKQALEQRYIDLKIISPAVSDQLTPLLK